MTIPAVAFLGGSIGGWELVVVGMAVLILFGPKRLPEIARTIGKVTAQLRGAAQDFRDQITKAGEEYLPPSESDPIKTEDSGHRPANAGGETKPEGAPQSEGASGPSGKGGDANDRAG